MTRVVANKNANNKFRIPVIWEVCDFVKVQAESIEEAFEWVKENIDYIPLGDEPEYVDGSYMIAADSPEECEIYK